MPKKKKAKKTKNKFSFKQVVAVFLATSILAGGIATAVKFTDIKAYVMSLLPKETIEIPVEVPVETATKVYLVDKESVLAVTVSEDKKITLPIIEDELFIGWYANGSEVTNNTVYNTNTIVIARYELPTPEEPTQEVKVYVVNYDTIATQTPNSSGKIDLPNLSGEIDFVGWYNDKGVIVNADTVYTETTVITAVYTALYKVTFIDFNNLITIGNIYVRNNESMLGAPAVVQNYINSFDNVASVHYRANFGSGISGFNFDIPIVSDLVVYVMIEFLPVEEGNRTTVSDLNGSVEILSDNFDDFHNQLLNITPGEKEGFKFLGWYLEFNGEVYNINDIYYVLSAQNFTPTNIWAEYEDQNIIDIHAYLVTEEGNNFGEIIVPIDRPLHEIEAPHYEGYEFLFFRDGNTGDILNQDLVLTEDIMLELVYKAPIAEEEFVTVYTSGVSLVEYFVEYQFKVGLTLEENLHMHNLLENIILEHPSEPGQYRTDFVMLELKRVSNGGQTVQLNEIINSSMYLTIVYNEYHVLNLELFQDTDIVLRVGQTIIYEGIYVAGVYDFYVPISGVFDLRVRPYLEGHVISRITHFGKKGSIQRTDTGDKLNDWLARFDTVTRGFLIEVVTRHEYENNLPVTITTDYQTQVLIDTIDYFGEVESIPALPGGETVLSVPTSSEELIITATSHDGYHLTTVESILENVEYEWLEYSSPYHRMIKITGINSESIINLTFLSTPLEG